MADTTKQLQILTDYRGRLESLGSKSGADLDALMSAQP